MSASNYGFETLSVHAGAAPDPATGARAQPIYQTTAYVFDDADHAAALFNLQTVGFIYSRLTNPTNAALETRIATLEGGRGCTVASSGHAAQVLALFPLTLPIAMLHVFLMQFGGGFGAQSFFQLWSAELFPTLVRFDVAYFSIFKCNRQRIADYPNLSNYMRELYQVPGVAETVNMDHIKRHYYLTHHRLNPSGVVPVSDGPDLHAPHGRADLGPEALPV